jgi:hypothetical protein
MSSPNPDLSEEPHCRGDRAQEGRDREASLMMEERAKALAHICSMCEPYALGWRAERVVQRILDIERWVALDRSIPVEKRRGIARKVSDLLNELQEQGCGGLSEETLLDLAALAQGAVERTGRGGDRRSREHSSEASVPRMIVRLWLKANERGGFALNGPLPKFVAGLCGFLGVNKPTDEAIRKIHKIIKPAVKKIDKASFASALYGSAR